MVCQLSWQWLAWWRLQPQTVGVLNPIISVVICNHQWWHQCCWSYDFFALGMYVQSSHLFYLGTFCLTLPNMAVTVSSVVIPIETLWRRKETFTEPVNFKIFSKIVDFHEMPPARHWVNWYEEWEPGETDKDTRGEEGEIDVVANLRCWFLSYSLSNCLLNLSSEVDVHGDHWELNVVIWTCLGDVEAHIV